jgi:hypothetical protein
MDDLQDLEHGAADLMEVFGLIDQIDNGGTPFPHISTTC